MSATSSIRPDGPDPSAPPREGKRARTRRALLDAAGRVFAERGVPYSTIDHIAEAASVSVGTVYSHFGNKDALALAFFDQAMERMELGLAAARDRESPIERVLAAGDAYLQFMFSEPAACRYALSRGLTPPENSDEDEFAREVGARVQTALLAVAGDLKTAMDEGEVPVMPLDEVMVFLWGAWMGVGSMVLRQDTLRIPEETAERALARARRLLLAALTVDPLPDDPLTMRSPAAAQN